MGEELVSRDESFVFRDIRIFESFGHTFHGLFGLLQRLPDIPESLGQGLDIHIGRDRYLWAFRNENIFGNGSITQMRDLKIVREDTLHETIASYIRDGDHIIADIDEMKSLICDMIKVGHMFAMDRDRLRDAIEDFVYLCQPDDELNKDRLMKSLEYDDEETDEEYEDDYSPRPPVKRGLPETRHAKCQNICKAQTICSGGVCHKIEEATEAAEKVVEDVSDAVQETKETVADVSEVAEAVADAKEEVVAEVADVVAPVKDENEVAAE
jgi:hypothetical protein